MKAGLNLCRLYIVLVHYSNLVVPMYFTRLLALNLSTKLLLFGSIHIPADIETIFE